MTNLLKKYPLHIFLFVSYLILFLYQENRNELELKVIWRSLSICIIESLILFGIIYILLKDIIKAGILTTSLNLVLFNYGIIYDLVEKLYFHGFWPFLNIHRYLLAASILYVIFMVWLVVKKLKTGQRVNYFINSLLIFLVLYNSAMLLLGNQKSVLVNEKIVAHTYKQNTQLDLPNLYYVVLDGYANNSVLKEFYNYDNSTFLNFLKNNGFSVGDSSCSNYYSTLPSLAATLNMDYHQGNSDPISLLKNNVVFDKLKQLGYTIVNLESGYSVTENFSQCDSSISIHSPNEFERSLMKFTILRLDDLFGVLHYKRLVKQIQCLKEMKRHSKRTFYFIHIVAPHPPYVFDENGKHLYSSKTHQNSWEPRAKYVQQTKYINKVMIEFIKHVVDLDNNAAIILQSDHGPWLSGEGSENVFKARSMILNAFRFPSKEGFNLYSKITSVNTFRAFLKFYADTNFKYLPDRAAGKEELMQSVKFNNLKQNDLHE